MMQLGYKAQMHSLLGSIGAILLNAVLEVNNSGLLVGHGHSHQAEEDDLEIRPNSVPLECR